MQQGLERAEVVGQGGVVPAARQVEIPLVIDGQEVRTGRLADCVMPHKHAHKLGCYHKAGEKEVKAAIKAAEKARPGWSAMPFQQRAAILLKAAEQIAAKSLPSVLMAKESVERAFEVTLQEGLRFERRVFSALFATLDQKEGMSAFAENRKPDFKNG